MDAYGQTLAELYALATDRGPDLRLARVRQVLAHVGSPEQRLPVIHIGGTNGKGSTAALLDAVLRRAGYRVGLYTSPHLIDFRERIRIDGRPMAEAEVVERARVLRSIVARTGTPLAFFEVVTVMAFDAFARAQVDVAVLEVGLGGRLDATNVGASVATAITSIGYDHQEYLGTTLLAIAREKGGIMRPGVPTVVGPVPPPAERTLLAQARAVGAPVALYGRDYGVADAGEGFDVVAGDRRWSDLRVGLRGRFQRINAATAVLLLQRLQERFPVTDGELREGLRAVSWPGRMDVVSIEPLVVLDGAHNPSAARALRDELGRVLSGRRLRLVYGAMRDKDWGEMWTALRPLVADAIVTQPRTPRSAAADAIARAIGRDVPVRVIQDPEAAVAAALETSAPDDAVLVTGSLFLVGDVYPFFRRGGGSGAESVRWNPNAPDARPLRA